MRSEEYEENIPEDQRMFSPCFFQILFGEKLPPLCNMIVERNESHPGEKATCGTIHQASKKS
jgi:hypothetical protein